MKARKDGVEVLPIVDSPAAQAAIERQRASEAQLSHWRSRARKAEDLVVQSKAALDGQEGKVCFIEAGDRRMYEEAHVLALKMARWHPDNRADLAILVKLDADGDRVAEITASPDFRKELAAIHLRRDLNCAAWLQSHCLAPGKGLLAKGRVPRKKRETRFGAHMAVCGVARVRGEMCLVLS